MIDHELIEEITKGITFPIAQSLRFWSENNHKFEQFVRREKTKIRGKMFQGKGKNKRPKSDNQLSGIVCELWVAYLILSLDACFEVEYEKYGKKEKGPDLTVTFHQSPSDQSIGFNVEVTRFCPTRDEIDYYKVKEEIVRRIKMIPSDLKFSLSTISQEDNPQNEMDVKPDFVFRFKSEKEDIFQYIENTILSEKNKLPYDTSFEYPIPGFENEFYLILYKPSKQSQKLKAGRTAFLGGDDPIFYTQKEYEQFVRKIFKDKLKQMHENEINILFIISDSYTYDVVDLEPALELIRYKVLQKDNDFFVKELGIQGGIPDFLKQYKNLSGLLFIDSSREEGMLLRNGQSNLQIPKIIMEYLMKIKRIIARDKRLNCKLWG